MIYSFTPMDEENCQKFNYREKLHFVFVGDRGSHIQYIHESLAWFGRNVRSTEITLFQHVSGNNRGFGFTLSALLHTSSLTLYEYRCTKVESKNQGARPIVASLQLASKSRYMSLLQSCTLRFSHEGQLTSHGQQY